MPKKKQPDVEILPANPLALKEAVLDQLVALVAEKVAEKLARNTAPPQAQPEQSLAELSEEVLVEPWFLPKEIAYAILRLLPVSHQRKWSHYFEDWGCLICGRKKVNHFANGFCFRCRVKVSDRLKRCLKKRAQEDGPSPEDQVAKIVSRIANAERLLAGKTERVERPALTPERAPRLLKPARETEEPSAQKPSEERSISRQRRWQIKKEIQGLCITCGKPREHYESYCDAHAARLRERSGCKPSKGGPYRLRDRKETK